MDDAPAAVEELLKKHGYPRLIHGHTHRPALHALNVGGHAVERLVLADWRPGHCEYLQVDAQGLQRKLLPA